MYVTNQRETILAFLTENRSRHLTADDVVFALKECGKSIGKTTIYRYFELLESQGKLRKFSLPNGKGACYQYIGDDHHCEHHYHFLCDVCNDLKHVECDMLQDISEHIHNEHGFRVNNAKTVYYGTCEACRKVEEYV